MGRKGWPGRLAAPAPLGGQPLRTPHARPGDPQEPVAWYSTLPRGCAGLSLAGWERGEARRALGTLFGTRMGACVSLARQLPLLPPASLPGRPPTPPWQLATPRLKPCSRLAPPGVCTGVAGNALFPVHFPAEKLVCGVFLRSSPTPSPRSGPVLKCGLLSLASLHSCPGEPQSPKGGSVGVE